MNQRTRLLSGSKLICNLVVPHKCIGPWCVVKSLALSMAINRSRYIKYKHKYCCIFQTNWAMNNWGINSKTLILSKTIEPGDTAKEFPPNDIQDAAFDERYLRCGWYAKQLYFQISSFSEHQSIFLLGDVVHLLSSHDADYTPKIYWRGIVKNAWSSRHLIDEDYAGGREDRTKSHLNRTTIPQSSRPETINHKRGRWRFRVPGHWNPSQREQDRCCLC